MTLVLLGVIALARPSGDRPSVPPKEYAYSVEKASAFGCLAQSDLDRLVELWAVQKDEAAASLHLVQLIQSGRCRYIPVNTQLVIEDISVWKNQYQARIKGDPQSYWIPREAVAKKEVTTTAVTSP